MQSLTLCLTRDNLSRPWGFRLQGGFDTGYPLSVQRVFSGSPAEGVLQRGDTIHMLDNCETQNLNSKEIQDIIRISERQLNCIVERSNNKENFQDLIDETEPKVSVKAVRNKFLSSENTVPKPFGEFGTYFKKKDNIIPTSTKIEMEHDYKFEQDCNYHNQTEEVDDNVDYSFMSLSVSERKKLFTTPNDNNILKTNPRQRAHSVRPSQSPYERTTKNVLYKPQQNYLNHGNGNIINSRTIVGNRYPAYLKPKTEKSFVCNNESPNIINNKYATIAFEHPKEPIYPSNRNTQIILNLANHSDVTKNQITTHIYRCGGNQEDIMGKGRYSDSRPLIVKTYPIQSLPQSESPRMFRPAYSALGPKLNQADNWSTISMRSEPYSGFPERIETCRSNHNPVSMDRNSDTCLGVIRIQEPRMSAISATPSFRPNETSWEVDNSPTFMSDQSTHHYYVKTSPVAMNTTSIRREITVPRSHSNVTINQVRKVYDDSHSQVSWLKTRASLDGGSDF